MTIIKEQNQLSQSLNQYAGKKGRIMAIDVGTKRIGLALSDESRFIATPKLIIKRLSNLKDFAKIKEFILVNKICAIVIGWPLNMDESENEMSSFAVRFAENFDKFLEEEYPIFLFDERLSSFKARQFNYSALSRGKRKDKFYDDIAASVILQHFLEALD